MRHSWIAFVVATLAWNSSSSQDATSGADGSLASGIEEVVVTGEQPGPQLWKATKGAHILWIYGTVTPKPRDITWRSKQVEQVLDSTQEIINQQLQGTSLPANIDLGLDTRNPIKLISVSRKLRKLREAHTPPPLHEVVPADLYERFSRLKSRYMPRRDSIEHVRPRDAAGQLYAAAVEASGLTSRAMIHEEVHRLARKRRIKVSEVTLDKHFDLPTLVDINAEFNEPPSSMELACLESTIDQLESELPTITARANAWAVGDVKALRALPTLRREICDRAQWSAPRWSDLDPELESLWLSTIEAAVARNQSTLVLLDVAEIFESDGLVARLIERGYQVEGP